MLRPWLREHESCLLYSDAGVGKSLFALSAALAVAGNGSFLGWKPDAKADGNDWRVLYADGEMHMGDIQERAGSTAPRPPAISNATGLFQPREFFKGPDGGRATTDGDARGL